MRHVPQNKLAVFVIAVLMVVSFSPLVYAQYTVAEPPDGFAEQKLRDARDSAKERREALEQQVAERREAAKTRLEDAKLRACQNREKAIGNIMARMADRGQKHLDLFGTISLRVQDFYTDKSLSLSNYSQLVAEAETKKTAAQAAIDETKSVIVDFKCDGEDPKGAAEVFRGNLNSQKEALKEYRAAVKNLIVGVKSALPGATEEGGAE